MPKFNDAIRGCATCDATSKCQASTCIVEVGFCGGCATKAVRMALSACPPPDVGVDFLAPTPVPGTIVDIATSTPGDESVETAPTAVPVAGPPPVAIPEATPKPTKTPNASSGDGDANKDGANNGGTGNVAGNNGETAQQKPEQDQKQGNVPEGTPQGESGQGSGNASGGDSDGATDTGGEGNNGNETAPADEGDSSGETAPDPDTDASSGDGDTVSDSSNTSNTESTTNDEICVELDWLISHGLERGILRAGGRTNVLCPGKGLPCGTAGHLLQYCDMSDQCSLQTYEDLCKTKECIRTTTRVAQLRSSFDWSVVSANADSGGTLSLTSFSIRPGSGQWHTSRIVARVAYRAKQAGYASVLDEIVMVGIVLRDFVSTLCTALGTSGWTGATFSS